MDNYFFKSYLFLIFLLSSILLVAQKDSRIDLANEYYFTGQSEKALDLYKDLSKSNHIIPHIHANYVALLLSELNYDEAEKYLNRVIKYFPTDPKYQVDLLHIYHLSENNRAKDKMQTELLANNQNNQYRLNVIAQHLVNKEMLPEATLFLKRARRINGNPRSFALDLAAIYRMQDDKESMAEEYLNYAMINPNNTNYIKNIFQVLFTEAEDLDFLERSLIKKVQQYPDEKVYADLLIWVELQRKNFYGAFIQARALDKRFGRPGDESMTIANIAMDNKAWADAIEIYDYVIDEYGRAYHYANARQMRIQCKEQLVKEQYPVQQSQIRSLTNEYQQLYNELGPTKNSLEALRNKAMLHAFYLSEKDSAIKILESIIQTPRIDPTLIHKSKMSLGDIHLLNGNPWEASLLYSQVEKSNKYSVVGYNAKLKNAKLHYYNGNFALAESALGVLKRATTKEISNDAMDLGLLINNNTILDTTDRTMKAFASIELLIYQNQVDSAVMALESLITENPNHSLIDESYWLLADIKLKSGLFSESIDYLNIIIAEYPEDIWGDDAFFRKAEIHEKQLNDKETAQELYREFISEYPGSLYTAEARKRFRLLRGDSIN